MKSKAGPGKAEPLQPGAGVLLSWEHGQCTACTAYAKSRKTGGWIGAAGLHCLLQAGFGAGAVLQPCRPAKAVRTLLCYHQDPNPGWWQQLLLSDVLSQYPWLCFTTLQAVALFTAVCASLQASLLWSLRLLLSAQCSTGEEVVSATGESQPLPAGLYSVYNVCPDAFP